MFTGEPLPITKCFHPFATPPRPTPNLTPYKYNSSFLPFFSLEIKFTVTLKIRLIFFSILNSTLLFSAFAWVYQRNLQRLWSATIIFRAIETTINNTGSTPFLCDNKTLSIVNQCTNHEVYLTSRSLTILHAWTAISVLEISRWKPNCWGIKFYLLLNWD